MKNDIDKGLLNIGDVRSYIAQTFYELDKGFLTELHLPDFYDNIQIISKSFDIEYLTNSIDTNKWKIYLQSLRNDIDRYKFCNNEMLKILHSHTLLQLDTIEKGILNIENLENNPKTTQKQNVQKEIGGVIERTLTMKQIALKFVFEKKQITEQNKNNIAANYNWISKNSGEKLKREYDYFQKRNNRIGQIKDQTPKKQKNRIELFESVLSLLEGDTIEIQNEIEILKSKMENDDL